MLPKTKSKLLHSRVRRAPNWSASGPARRAPKKAPARSAPTCSTAAVVGVLPVGWIGWMGQCKAGAAPVTYHKCSTRKPDLQGRRDRRQSRVQHSELVPCRQQRHALKRRVRGLLRQLAVVPTQEGGTELRSDRRRTICKRCKQGCGHCPPKRYGEDHANACDNQGSRGAVLRDLPTVYGIQTTKRSTCVK